MFEHLKYGVQALKRVRVGNLTLGDLPEGKVRPVAPKEITSLLQQSSHTT